MRNTSEHKDGFSLLRSICSACLGFLFCCSMLFVAAIFVDRGLLAEKWIEIVSWCMITVSALATAFGAAGKCDRRIFGSLCAGFLFFVFAMVCGEVLGGMLDIKQAILMGVILLATSFFGAIISGLIRG